MKTAQQLADELASAAPGNKIVITKRPGSQNWVAGTTASAEEYKVKLLALLKSDPIVDWSGAPDGCVTAVCRG